MTILESARGPTIGLAVQSAEHGVLHSELSSADSGIQAVLYKIQLLYINIQKFDFH